MSGYKEGRQRKGLQELVGFLDRQDRLRTSRPDPCPVAPIHPKEIKSPGELIRGWSVGIVTIMGLLVVLGIEIFA